MSRQQRRLQLKQGLDTVSKRGMDLTAGQNEQWWSVAAAARIFYNILDGRAPARAAQAAKRAHQFFETSLEHNPSKYAIECAKGCAFCCHVTVTATAPEIFLLANTIRETYAADFENWREKVRAADAATRGLGGYERALKKVPCGLLESGACTVYGVRPAACRGMTSISMKSCERAFNGEDVQVQTPSVWTVLRAAHKQAICAALLAADLPAESYELHQALLVALQSPDAESRWLAGKDVFAGVAREMPGSVERAANENIVGQLAAAALGRELPLGR